MSFCCLKELRAVWKELLAAVVVIVCLSAVTVFAQVTASITGTVTDNTGAVVPGATVTVKDVERGQTRVVESNNAGRYTVPALPVGQYEVQGEKSGFKLAVRRGITLVVGQQAVVDLKLEVGSLEQQVTVTAEAPLVSATTSSVAGLVGERQVKELPLNGRSFDNLITLNPGTALIVSNSNNSIGTGTSSGNGNLFAISGNRGDFNIFLLNGIEYTGVSSTVMMPGGASKELLGVDAIREFNVQGNTYGAEYGKRPGGQISAVTMSGTNQLHGTAFEFLRNSFFDARNFFDKVPFTPPFRRNQFGGALGGPIKKDKTFIFGNYEGFRQTLAFSSLQVVPDANARRGILPGPNGTLENVGVAPGMAPYFQLWPAPNGPELGGGAAEAFSNPVQSIREDFGTVRVDQNIKQMDNLAGIYTIDDGFNLSPSGPLQQIVSNLRSQVLSLQETHVFSPTVLLTSRAGYSRASWDYSTAPPVTPPGTAFIQGMPVGGISIGGNFGGSSSFSGAGSAGNQQRELMARNLFTFTGDSQVTRGNHQLSFGAWFQRVRSNENAADARFGSVIFGSLSSFLAGQASSVTATLNPTEVPWREFLGAWYAQDSIKVRPTLTVTAGIRHEFNNGWNSPKSLASNYVFGPNGIFLTSPRVSDSLFTDNHGKWLFSPRVGVAWAPFGEGKTSIHAGFGLYYNMMDYLGDAVDANPILPGGATVPFNNRVSITSGAQFPLVLSPTSLLPGVKPTPNGVQSNFLTPQVQEYMFKVEQGITPNLMFSVGYTGEHGVHLPLTTDMNAPFPEVLANGSLFLPPGTPRLNPALANGRDVRMEDNSSYNALMVDVTKRFSRDFQFRANYTWAKALDNLSSTILGGGGGPGGGGALTLEVPRNTRVNWGPSNFDIRNRLSANFTYDVPVGQGKMWLKNANGIVDKVVSGWELNSIVTAQTGFYVTPLAGSNRSGTGDTRNPDRVNLNPNFTGDPVTGSPEGYFNPQAFLLPALGTFGNAGKNKYAGPGLTEWDLSIFKDTRITERTTVQFRFEAFNILNHTNFGMPSPNMFTSSGAVSPSFGLLTDTFTTSRQLQLALKLLF